MVAYLRNNILLASLVVLIFLGSSSSTTFNKKFDDDVTDEICSLSQDPSFCSKFLKSNPSAAKSDVSGLETDLVKNAKHNIYKAMKTLDVDVKKEKNPSLKKIYGACWGYFKTAADHSDSALKALAAKDNDSFYNSVSSMNSLARDCSVDLNSLQADTQLMTNMNDVLNACDLALVISDWFSSK